MKYSIIIPTHNRPEAILKTIDSLSKLKDSEILIIENNSTLENKKKYRENNWPSNAKFISKDGISLPQARYLGISKALGEYIFNLDDDDFVTCEFIDFLNENQSSLTRDVYRFPYFRNNKKMKPTIFGKMTKNSWFKTILVSTYLTRREVFKSEWFDVKIMMMEDQWIGFNLSSFEQEYIDVPSVIYNKYFVSDSMTRTKRNILNDSIIFDYILNMQNSNKLLIKAVRLFMQERRKFSKDDFKRIVYSSAKKIEAEKNLPFDYKIWMLWMKLTKRR